MDYANSLAWLDLLHAETALKRSDLGIERIQRLLVYLGNPHHGFKSIHVTGTSGKGSTCYFISSILHAAGYKVGLNISPHLQSVNERIQLNGNIISNERFASLATKMREVMEKNDWPEGLPSYFETVVAMAFLFFQQEKVDFAVVEVGLGGTLDATNVLLPLVSVITSVSLDHIELLGPSLEEIATNKSGIIKENVPVVMGEVSSTALNVVKEKALEKNAPLFFSHSCSRIKTDLHRLKFSAQFQNNQIVLETPALGEFQLLNAAHAIRVMDILNEKGFVIGEKELINGFLNAKIPGRFEVMENGRVILDGAHNVEKIQGLADTLRSLNLKPHFLIGILKSKQAREMMACLAPVAMHITFVRPDLPKPYWAAEELQKMAEENNIPCSIMEGSESELNYFIENFNGKILVITGSLYLVGIMRNYWFPVLAVEKAVEQRG